MLAIDYEAEQGPTIAVRLQELFGLNTHPSIAKGAVPLVLELLSPAHRPVQVTRDLPGFWRGSYAGGAFRSARALSQTSLAGGPGERDADPARQAAGNVISLSVIAGHSSSALRRLRKLICAPGNPSRES